MRHGQMSSAMKRQSKRKTVERDRRYSFSHSHVKASEVRVRFETWRSSTGAAKCRLRTRRDTDFLAGGLVQGRQALATAAASRVFGQSSQLIQRPFRWRCSVERALR